MSEKPEKTHFGFENVDWDEKQKKVAEVFASVAAKYDLMNDAMSLGVHHLWKRFTVMQSAVRPGDQVLDLAGGSGDITRLFAKRVGKTGKIILADINSAMLEVGRDRLLNEGLHKNIAFVQANAEALPFAARSFHVISIGFGLRNVTDKTQALRELCRTLKPGGKLLVLEFSRPSNAVLRAVYDWYSFNVLPRLGSLIAGDAKSYQYLVESIRKHPPQEELKSMIEEAGFDDCRYINLTGGIVALHIAHKY